MFWRTARSYGLLATAFVTFGTGRISAQQAPVPLQLLMSPAAAQAAADTTTSAFLYVYLANADGTPKNDAAISPDSGGLPVDWILLTIGAPPALKGPCTQRVRNMTQTTDIAGQLKVVRVSRRTNNVKDPAAGLYTLEVAPAIPCGNGVFTKWVAGEYHFMLTYAKAGARGNTLGALTIR